jgi:uncharacterized membrane protein (DUF106 family)
MKLLTVWLLSLMLAGALAYGAEPVSPEVRMKQLQARKNELSQKYQRAQQLAEALREMDRIETEYKEIFAEEQKLLKEKKSE